MILITGGTGLVGSHLLYHLLTRYDTVRAIYRQDKKLDIVKHVFSYYTDDVSSVFDRIEWIQTDLLNIPDLTVAFQNVNYVYHCAAFVSFEPDKYHLLRKTNIEGTANIVNLCIANQVKKLCYVSSIAAIGESINNQIIDEETSWNSEADNSVYAITKYGAEIEVWRGSQEGLEVVIVNPGVIIGGGIWRHGSGNIFKKVYNGLPYFTDGMIGCVDVKDVVKCMMKLQQSDIKNERFILISENISYKHFVSLIAKSLGVKPPKKEAKRWLLSLGWRLDWLVHKLTGKRRKLVKQLVASLYNKSIYSNGKITSALGCDFKSVSESIEVVAKQFLKDNLRK